MTRVSTDYENSKLSSDGKSHTKKKSILKRKKNDLSLQSPNRGKRVSFADPMVSERISYSKSWKPGFYEAQKRWNKNPAFAKNCNKEIEKFQTEETIQRSEFVGIVKAEKDRETEFVTDKEIYDMQSTDPEIKCLIWQVKRKIPVRNWPQNLKEYRKFANRFVMLNELLYFMKLSKNDCEYIPVVSLSGLIGLTIITHLDFAHPGKPKMLDLLKKRVFHPMVEKVVNDLVEGCEICQKRKVRRVPYKPPTLKVKTKEPFELLCVDLLSLPRTPRGYLGLLVAVDHHSKFLYAIPFKNKSTEHIIDLMKNRVFPMMLIKAKNILSDNGKEFSSSSFDRFLTSEGIGHIYTTPYRAPSNGLAERTNRTIIEILRTLDPNLNWWDENLNRAVWAYNSTQHKALGVSPSQYLLNYNKFVKTRALTEKQKLIWKTGNEKFIPYTVGEKVLKRVETQGNLNIDKLSEKYQGPYEVIVAHQNELTYVLKNIETKKEIRAHFWQLVKYKELPTYIKDHPVFIMAKENHLYKLEDEPAESERRQIYIEFIPPEKKRYNRSTQTEDWTKEDETEPERENGREDGEHEDHEGSEMEPEESEENVDQDQVVIDQNESSGDENQRMEGRISSSTELERSQESQENVSPRTSSHHSSFEEFEDNRLEVYEYLNLSGVKELFKEEPEQSQSNERIIPTQKPTNLELYLNAHVRNRAENLRKYLEKMNAASVRKRRERSTMIVTRSKTQFMRSRLESSPR